jgi:hypothetical protein
MLARLTVAWSLAVALVSAQPARKLYVEPFKTKGGARELYAEVEKELAKDLSKIAGMQLVKSAQEADWIIAGRADTFIKGKLAMNPRVRYSTMDSRPVYGGYLSLELKDRKEDTLWSYIVTPRKMGAEDVNRNLAEQAVKALHEFLANAPRIP